MLILEDILSQEIIQKLGWTLLHFIWQAVVVALLLAILLRLLRKSAANLRYIIACLALALIVLLPVITIQLVSVSAPHMATHIEPAPAPSVSPTEETRVVEIAVLEEPVQPESVTLVSADSWKQRTVELLEPALPYIVSGWLIGVFGLSIWHLGGWAQLQRLKRRMVKQVDDALRSKLKVLAQRIRVKQTVQLMESALVQIPTVVGWLRPVILLPASALTGLSAEQLEAILAHELAHIKRFDYLVNMLQTVVEILGFYHPAVWWVSHKIRAERENCCDDLAVSISGDRVRYARALTSMEEIRAHRNELAVAATGGNLSGRIRRLVGKDSTDSSRTSWIPSVVTILLIAIIVIPTTLALTAHDKTEHSAQFLLDKMLEHRSRVKNLQYIAETAGRDETDEFIKWMEDRIKKRREEGASERSIGFSKRSLERIKRWRKEHENRYETIKCTIDNEGRSKTELTRGDYDASGKKMPGDYKLIQAWNGIQSVKFYQKRGSLEATLEATIKDVPSASIHPWRLFISDLCQYLKETVEAKRDVSVEKLKDGTYRIAFDFITKRRLVAVIDPSKGYTCALREDYNDQGKCTSRRTSTYEEVAEGIWFPVSGQLETFSSDSPNYKRSFKSSQIRINGPAFNASYFDVNMPKGTIVTDEVRGKRYVVGSKRVHDLDEPQKPSAEMEEVDPNSWQEKFYSIYSLEDGEVLKRIAPPFIPERRNYFKFAQPGYYSPNTPYHLATRYVFNWDGKLSRRRGDRMGGGIPRLDSILESVIGLGNREYDIPPEILSADMSGDWIVRKGTPQEELLQALEQIIKEETGRDIDFVKQKVETEVIVARGKYRLTPLPNTKEKDCVHVYTDKLDSGAGGGSGTVGGFLRGMGNRVEMIIIDRTDSGDVELSWRNHWSANLSTLRYNEQLHNEKVDMLLNNLTRQTGLTFERTTAPVEKWFVAEQDSSADSIPVPVLVKSPAPSAEDTPLVAVDCLILIVEVSLDSKMDRETTIMAENLLGNKISLRDTKVDVLLRKAAGATAATKDKSAENKRVTQDQFKALTDMLTSRGYMKILMNPRMHVVDGKTAKIMSRQENIQDSLEITPHVFADGHITLLVEAAISSKSMPKGLEQIPIVSTREISTRVRTSPGESIIIGGLKETGKSSEADGNVKDSQELTKEVLFILTPTIINTTGDQTDVQTENTKDSSVTQSEFKKNLATGVTVELIGMCEYPSADKQWWQSDGSLLVNPPYDESDIDILSSRKPDAIPIEFAFRLSGNLGEPAWEAQVKRDDQAFVWWTGRRAKDGEFLTDIKSIGMFVKSDQKTLDLRLGFSFADQPYEWVEFKNISIMPNMSKYTVFNSEKRIFRSFDQGEEQILKRFFNRVDSEIQKLKNNHPYLSDWDKEKTETESISTGKEIIDTRLTYNHATYSGKSPGGRKDWCGQDGCYIKIKIYTELEGPYMKTRVFPLKGRLSVIATVITGNPENPELEQKINEIIHLAAVSAVQESDLQVEPELAQLRAAFEAQKFAHSRDGFIALVQEIGNKEPESFLIEQLESDNRARRCQAALALEILGDRRGIPAIVRELNDTSYRPTTRIRSDGGQDQKGQIRQDHYYAALLLGISGDKRAVPALIEATRDEEINYQAAISLGQIGDMRAVPALRVMLEKYSNEPFVRLFAGYGLAMLNDEEGLRVVIDTLNNQELHWVDRRHAIRALGELRDKQAVPHLIVALKDDHPNIRVSAARALGAIGDASALLALEQALKDKAETKANMPTTVSKAATEAIAQIRTEGRKAAVKVEAKSAESADKLKKLGLAVAMYADDHDKKLPDTLEVLKPYIANEQDFLWIVNNVEYICKNETYLPNQPRIPVAYEKTLIEKQSGTNVLFLDGHVEFLTPQRLKELGISKSKEVIGMNPADKAVYKQLETIIVDLSEPTPTTSFSDALEVISNSVDPPLDIVVNWKDLLENADIEPDTAINMDGLLEVPLGTGLESLLNAVASGVTKLNYVVENGVIRIGTLRFLPHKMYHGVYDISGLVGTAADADNLVRRITETIEPDSWYKLSDKGEGTIIAYPLRQPKNFAVMQTYEIHQQIEHFLDDMRSSRDELQKNKEYEQRLSGVQTAEELKLLEISKRMESAKKLSNLGHALFIYANDHDDKYPDSLHTFTEYLKLEDFNWAMTNVEYLARGKTIAVRPDIVIAYDKKLLTKGKGTNVLFNDSHVEFVKPERLKELGISATEIQIETRILLVSEDFLQSIGLDANSVDSSDAWSEHLVADSAAEPNSETYSLILDELHIRFLLKAVQDHQGSKMLVSPRVLTREGTTASMAIMTEEYYVLGYNEPNRPSDKPEPKLDKVELGARLWLKPELIPDNEKIKLDFKMEFSQLLGYEERKYKGKYIYLVPRTEVVSTEMPCLIPDGKTLLIGGQKITEQVSAAPILSKLPVIGELFRSRDKTKDQRILLILVKPIINPQQKASKILPGQADSEEHIKHLGRLLEKKLNPPAEPK